MPYNDGCHICIKPLYPWHLNYLNACDSGQSPEAGLLSKLSTQKLRQEMR